MPPPRQAAQGLHSAFERPAKVVLTVCQMLLGLGLAVAIVLKVYMLVFSNHACTEDGETLGNLIRCMPILAILGHFLLALTAFRFAALLFERNVAQIYETLLLGISGVVLLLLSELTLASLTWELALVLLALGSMIGGAAVAIRLLGGQPPPG